MRKFYVAGAVLAVLIFFLGRMLGSHQVEVQETKQESRMVYQNWVEFGREDYQQSHEAETIENVRIVTRWLRRDGTPAKEVVKEAIKAEKVKDLTVTSKVLEKAGIVQVKEVVIETREVRPTERKYEVLLIGATGVPGALKLDFKPYAGAVVTRQVGELFGVGIKAGVYGNTRREAGLVIGVSF